MLERIKSVVKYLAKRLDATPSVSYLPGAMQNLATGLGGETDPLSYHVPVGPTILSHQMLQDLFDGGGTAARIVSANPKEAFRKGFTVEYHGDSEQEKSLVAEVTAHAQKIKLADRGYEAALLGRLFGGSGILSNTTDEDLENPFPVGQEIFSLVALDAREITPKMFYDPLSDQANSRFADHGFYQSNVLAGETYQTLAIHPDRISVFGGVITPRRNRWEKFYGWDSSILQQTWETIRMLSSDTMSKSIMMRDASIGVLKIERLWDLLTQEHADKLQRRMEIGHYARSSARIMPIDSEEDFQWVERTFAGIKDILEIDFYIVAASAEMPITVLFGRSPAGQNSTGKHDEINWHVIVEASQTQQYGPPIEEIIQRIAAFMGAKDLDNWSIKWLPLESLTSQEQADLEKTVTETDILRVQIGIDEAELIKWRHGQGEYRPDPPNFDPEVIEEWIAAADEWEKQSEENIEGFDK